MIVILGEIGVGKLIFVNLICWFYDLIFGEILIDGVDVWKWYVWEFRNYIVMVM